MASVDDVATYILEQRGQMTAMKLQKLVYYGQAWHLVWDEEALFSEPIEAWASGPVVRSLYQQHCGRFTVNGPEEISGGDSSRLTASERETIDAVLRAYGDKPAHWLSELTHSEEPWRRAREGLNQRERGGEVIPTDSMFEYYDSLTSVDAEAL